MRLLYLAIFVATVACVTEFVLKFTKVRVSTLCAPDRPCLPVCWQVSGTAMCREQGNYQQSADGNLTDALLGQLVRDLKIIAGVNCVCPATLSTAQPVPHFVHTQWSSCTLPYRADRSGCLQAVSSILICGLAYCLLRFGLRLYHATAGGRKWCARCQWAAQCTHICVLE